MQKLISATLLLLVAGAVTGTLLASRGDKDTRVPTPPQDLPTAALELLEARPFVVDEPFVHEWRAEQPLVHSGYLVVVRVPSELALPRATFEPVLYVGDETAERVNAPQNGDNLVLVVPAPERGGRVALDLARTPIWFGSLELPERIDAARIAAERRTAEARGIGPARSAAHARADEEPIRVRTRRELDAYLADLVELYSPEETDLVRQLRP
ncbi:MAG: hypothetical protein ABL998_16075 [Planctomycetota bacterium]